MKDYYPEVILPYLSYFFSDPDRKLVEVLADKTLTEEEISAAAGCDMKEELAAAYHKNLVSKEQGSDGCMRYILKSAADRVNNCAVFEQEIFRSIPIEGRIAIEKWHYDAFLAGKAAMTDEELALNANRYLPLEHIIKYARSMGSEFTIIPCDCHCKWEGETRTSDKNVCIMAGQGLNSHRDRGLGRQASLEEVIALLKKADNMGLMHEAEAEAICSCDRTYCYPCRASFALGKVHIYPATPYVVKTDPSRCVGCANCLRRCQFGALAFSNGAVAANPDKCWGCGICATQCPVGALTMGKR
jgi:NAD-dependent dihydropyrimidine dehydrogenase PreA subunit